MLKPFEPIMGWFDPSSMGPKTTCCCTGLKDTDGQNIYKLSLDIQNIDRFKNIANFKNLYKIEGIIYKSATQDWKPVKILKFDNTNGIVLDNQTIETGDTGRIDVMYTKTEANPNPMAPYIFPALLVLGGLYLFTRPEVQQVLTFLK